jgi:multidrug efflux pump subunit AcrA (membrane-fusion protein)
MIRPLVAITVVFTLTACGPRPIDSVETLQVGSGEFSISLISRGELRAAESTPIQPPQGSRNPRTIEWLAPNYSWVRKGEVIARFDISDAELQASRAGLEIDKVDLQVVGKERELQRQLSELGNQLDLVEIEKVMADTFAIDNELAYSRFEIIDATRDKVLLEYKSGHFEGKKENYSDLQNAEVAVLNAQRSTQESQYLEQKNLLDHYEVRAPHDGFFVYEKTWWGQQVDIGSTVFPANKIASIPNLDKMEAKLYVLETEAVGLSVGQETTVTIDAFPDRPISGQVSSISATAAPIERENPVKYFTVIVSLNQSDPEWITPEAAVTAEIHISRIEDTIAVPNQAVFQDDEGDWVLLRNGSKLVRRPVSLGVRGANRSQVLTGLQTGDEIALFPPGEADS